MGIPLTSNFDVNVALPLDARYSVADVTARDAIPSGVRYAGMLVYTVAEEKIWHLRGGIDNADWKPLKGSGGGGGSILWRDDLGASPIREWSNGFEYALFSPAEAQGLFATYKVPADYEAGAALQLNGVQAFCDDDTETVAFKLDCYLYKAGDVRGTPTSGVTTDDDSKTAGADALILFDSILVTDTPGQINGEDVSPGDTILIRLSLGSATTATEDVRFITDTCFVSQVE